MRRGQCLRTRNLSEVISTDPCGGRGEQTSLAYSEREMTKVPSQGMKEGLREGMESIEIGEIGNKRRRRSFLQAEKWLRRGKKKKKKKEIGAFLIWERGVLYGSPGLVLIHFEPFGAI